MAKLLKVDVTKNHFGLFCYAGHGMIQNGTQCILLNQFDKKTGFYKLHQLEKQIRRITQNNHNMYVVAIAACCRENFSTDRHSGCIEAKSTEEAEELF